MGCRFRKALSGIAVAVLAVLWGVGLLVVAVSGAVAIVSKILIDELDDWNEKKDKKNDGNE